MKTKIELLRNIVVAEALIKDTKEEFIKSVKNRSDDETVFNCYNRALMERNRKVINQMLKDLEKDI